MHPLDKLTGRQVASLALCAKYAPYGKSSSYGFCNAGDGPALASLGLVVEAFPGAYRATTVGAEAVRHLSDFDRYTADMLGDLPWSSRADYVADCRKAYSAPFSEAREIGEKIRRVAA